MSEGAGGSEPGDRGAGPGGVLEDATALAARPGALLGLDLGTKTLGVAVSDAARIVATPLEVIPRRNFRTVAARLQEIIDARGIVGIVLGLPRNMDGSEGPACQAARAFARNLAAAFCLPVVLWDERLSTVAAERALLEADSSRRRRGQVIDKVAAAYILQGALDRLRDAAGRGAGAAAGPAPGSAGTAESGR